MKHKTLPLVCLLTFCVAALAAVMAPAKAEAQQRNRDPQNECDCAALEAAYAALEAEITVLEGTIDGYNSQLSIPGQIASSLAGQGVSAVEGRCEEGDGRVGLESGWTLCFPIGNSAGVIPRITSLLRKLGYDPSDFREAADNIDDTRAILERAQRDRQRVLADCVRCHCDCV